MSLLDRLPSLTSALSVRAQLILLLRVLESTQSPSEQRASGHRGSYSRGIELRAIITVRAMSISTDNAIEEYWTPIFDVCHSLRCWSRAQGTVGGGVETSHWGMLLTIPTKGYLETELGPLPARDLEWIELSTKRVKGGRAGILVSFVDVRTELVRALSTLSADWSVRDSSWSVQGLFDDELLAVIHLPNPFYGKG
jgi:hypothetical protein